MIDRVFKFSNDIRVLNCTRHALNFQEADGSVVTVEPSGFVIDAAVTEIKSPFSLDAFGVIMVTPKYLADPEVENKIMTLSHEFSEHDLQPAIFLGSQIAAQAYPGLVAALVPVAGFERVPWDQKRMRIDKFTMF